MERAFIFDVFGTCVDWRNSVARDVARVLPKVDPFEFADAWRGEYQPAMSEIRSGRRGYVALDILHRENLDKVAKRFDQIVPDPDWLVAAWERLDPWPDVVKGLQSLREAGLIAPCSNGSISLMVRLARYGGLPWDCILGAEIARDYKPASGVYKASVAALGLLPGEVCMVAAHNDDLAAARAAGLQTAFVARPEEHGAGQTTDLLPMSDCTYVAEDFSDLASQVSA